MEWNQDNLAQFSTKAAGHMSKQLHAPNHEIEKDSGSIYSSGGIGFSGSGLEHGSSSKSTISASGVSALKEGRKAYKSRNVSKDFSQKELAQADNTANFLSMGASASFGEKRMYSKGASHVSTVKSSPLSVNLISSTATTKRSRANYKSTLTPHCQVEGCNLDLKLAKDYHRRHRICESHSKSPKVIIAGMERRFCQQCSRFHELSSFDDKKRSCRRRLSDHNARRRRPPPQAIHFNPVRLSTSLYDGRHQMNIAFNGQMNLPTNEILDSTPLLQIGVEKVLCYEGNVPQVFSQALEASLFASNLDIAPDLGHALSLLSTNTCGLSKPEPTSRDHLLMHGSQTSLAQLMTTTHGELDSWTASSSSEDKQVDQLSSGGRVHLLNSQDDGNIHFQAFQFKAPYDPGCFYPSQIN